MSGKTKSFKKKNYVQIVTIETAHSTNTFMLAKKRP